MRKINSKIQIFNVKASINLLQHINQAIYRCSLTSTFNYLDSWSPDQDYPSVWSQHLWKFCDRLLQAVPDLHFWAANCKHGVAPQHDWTVKIFTRPLRSPPTVVTEVALSEELGDDVAAYTERGVPDHTHGPPVKFVYHRGPSHDEEHPRNCVQCGKDVASFIRSLGVGQTDDNSSPSGEYNNQFFAVLAGIIMNIYLFP